MSSPRRHFFVGLGGGGWGSISPEEVTRGGPDNLERHSGQPPPHCKEQSGNNRTHHLHALFIFKAQNLN